MNSKKNTISNIFNLWKIIDLKDKKFFIPIVFLMVFASAAEVFSIGMLIPFLSVILDSSAVLEKLKLYDVPFILELDAIQIQTLITIIFISTALISGALRVLLIYVTVKLSFRIGTSLSTKIFQNTLYLDYETHKEFNSSSTIDAIINKTNTIINGAIMPSLVIVSSIIYGFTILLALAHFSPIQAIVATGILGLVYLLISLTVKRRILRSSQTISNESTSALKVVQEGLGGIRDLILDKSIPDFVDRYKNHDGKLRAAQGSNIFLSSSPKYILESIGISIIAIYAYTSKNTQSTNEIITTLSVLAICAQRLLPILQQGYSSWANISGASSIITEALEILCVAGQRINNHEKELSFNSSITLSAVSFKYKSRHINVLENINFRINYGDRIGLIGETGSGKSTLVDLLMGLLKPTHGHIIVDGIKITDGNIAAYQQMIAHVPQSVYLLDTSLKKNILLNTIHSNISGTNYDNSLKYSKLDSVINHLPNGDSEVVGERGLKLSGGQRQRIGIARALYKNPKILILDEATSALDTNTENEIMTAIQNNLGNTTIVMIAHRINTLKNCNRFIKIENGKIIEITKDQLFYNN